MSQLEYDAHSRSKEIQGDVMGYYIGYIVTLHYLEFPNDIPKRERPETLSPSGRLDVEQKSYRLLGRVANIAYAAQHDLSLVKDGKVDESPRAVELTQNLLRAVWPFAKQEGLNTLEPSWLKKNPALYKLDNPFNDVEEKFTPFVLAYRNDHRRTAGSKQIATLQQLAPGYYK